MVIDEQEFGVGGPGGDGAPGVGERTVGGAGRDNGERKHQRACTTRGAVAAPRSKPRLAHIHLAKYEAVDSPLASIPEDRNRALMPSLLTFSKDSLFSHARTTTPDN